MSADELRTALLEWVRKQGTTGYWEATRHMRNQGASEGELEAAWEGLIKSGDIELVPGYHPNYYLAKFRVRTQMRLL